MKNKYGVEEWNELSLNNSPMLCCYDGPIWSVIQIENAINKSLADNFINYNEWHRLMSFCADILERIINEKNS